MTDTDGNGGDARKSTPSRGSNTRDRILEWTIRVIEHEGETAVKVLDLHRETGISMGSIYHFFSEREDLIVNALAEIYRRNTASPFAGFGDSLADSVSLADFRRIMENYVRLIATPEGRDRRQKRALVYSTLSTRPALLEQVRESNRALIDELARIVAAAQQRGFVRAGLDPHVFSTWWQDLVVGRVISDTGLTDVDVTDWIDMSLQAINALAFGEAPV